MLYGVVSSVLIVDDNLGDTYLLQKTLQKFGAQIVDSVPSVEEAAKYIAGLAPFAHRMLPELVIVDLKMPRKSGFELICWLSRNPAYSQIPVIVYSASTDPKDRKAALELGARAYYQKTAETQKLTQIVEEILQLLQPT